MVGMLQTHEPGPQVYFESVVSVCYGNAEGFEFWMGYGAFFYVVCKWLGQRADRERC